ncbi:LuxR C-terminal-related transcriptional regulator [Oceanimonas smirnovii]|uniref:LuxR C-terminal-related transcriptional regulator n=1 Tax=Oceanimonas smirnovii TaxID=264574 RepID=UPI003AAC57C4
MTQDGSSYGIYLITPESPQNQLFVDYLANHVGCTVYVQMPSAAFGKFNKSCSLILLDCDYITIEQLPSWQESLPGELAKVSMAAFNISDQEHAMKMLACAQLKGIFYRNESLDIICKGVSALINGELWMSRDLMSRLIGFYRKYQGNVLRPTCGLTGREMEIIVLLSAGASNQDISERLFVSEHTVKSHLYNIFKKINVHNRIQALNWIHQNLGPLLPNINMERNVKQ